MSINWDTETGEKINDEFSRLRFGEWDETFCRVCGWKIVADGEAGCWKSNCSQRPAPKIRADAPADIFGSNCAAIEAAEWMKGKGWYYEAGYLEDFAYYARFWRKGANTISECYSQMQLSEAIARAIIASAVGTNGRA